MPATVFDKPMFPGAKLISSQITVTNTSGSYSQVITDERITAHMSAVRVEAENGTIFGGKISITTANGSYTISCPSVSGSTTVKVFFLKTTDDPTIVTSAEFDILNNRMNALENADIRYSVTIPASGWTLSDGEYIYTWSNVMITSGAAVDVEFLEDDGDLDIESLEFEKVSGGVKFTSPFIPNDDIPVSIRVINARFNLESDITAEQVSTSAVSGASNVDEALTALNSKFPNIERTKIGTTGSLYIHCINGMVVLTLMGYLPDSKRTTANQYVTIGSIPNGYRLPEYDIYSNATIGDNAQYVGLLRILTTGEISVYSATGSQQAGYGEVIY